MLVSEREKNNEKKKKKKNNEKTATQKRTFYNFVFADIKAQVGGREGSQISKNKYIWKAGLSCYRKAKKR